MKNKNLFIALLIFILFIGCIIYFGVQAKENRTSQWNKWQKEEEESKENEKNLKFPQKVVTGKDPFNDDVMDLSEGQEFAEKQFR